MLHLHPKRFAVDCEQWLLKVMCGSIEFTSLYMNNHTPKVLMISRLSCERAGTRYFMSFNCFNYIFIYPSVCSISTKIFTVLPIFIHVISYSFSIYVWDILFYNVCIYN